MVKTLVHADDYGRSNSINKVIETLIANNHLNSVSLIVGQSGYKNALKFLKKNKKKINIRLHLNLTDGKSLSRKIFYDFSFLKLLLMPYIPIYNRKIPYLQNEIYEQLKIYKKDLDFKEISLDSHQHIHMIPWICNTLTKSKKKYGIKFVRLPNEFLYISKLSDLFKLSYLKNILKFVVLKILHNKTKKQTDNFIYQRVFCGVLYTGINTVNSINKFIKLSKRKNVKNIELLFHPGGCKNTDKKLFTKNFYKYYVSKDRQKEEKVLREICLI